MYNNLNLDHANIISYTKFGKNLSICTKDIVRKRKGEVNEGPYLCYKFAENDK